MSDQAPDNPPPVLTNRGRSPEFLAHQFKPGQSGNPGGRPKGQNISTILRQLLESELGSEDLAPELRDDPKTIKIANLTVGQAIARILIRKAASGDIRFIQEVLNRMEGRVPLRIAGHDGGSLNTTVSQQVLDKVLNDPDAMEAAGVLADKLTSARTTEAQELTDGSSSS